MIKNYVLQADIEKDFVGVMSTDDIMRPGKIVGIIIPGEEVGDGWSELKIGLARRKITDITEFGEAKDITLDLTMNEKIWFGPTQMKLEFDYKVIAYPWWVVVWVRNATEKRKLYTIQVLIEV